VAITPWKLLIRSTLICGLTGTVLFGLALKRIEPLPLSAAPLKFEAKSAHQYMSKLAKGFENRVTWSESRRKAAQWLKDEFKKLGYSPRGLQFSEVIDGKKYTDLENVFVEKRGMSHPDEIIVAMAHYDITDTTVEGAMDDASGVGVVLELARAFSKTQSDRTLVFLLTDSEEFGSFWGARAFAKNYEKADKIVAAVNVDFLAPEKQKQILTLCDGLKTGFTPLWLREMALDSLRSFGQVDAADMSHILEFVQRAVQIPAADHGAFLAAGIPAFNWVGQTENFTHDMAHYHHTSHDVAEAMQPESFDQAGKAAERLIHSINALPKLPHDFKSSSYWKVSPHLYIEGWAATLLHILAFIPFLLYSIAKLRTTFREYPRDQVLAVFGNEAKSIGILLGSLLLGYVVMLLLPALNIITQYETFPATQKSLLLYTPNVIALLIVAGSVIGVYWLFRLIFSEPEDTIAHVKIRHAFHSGFLTVIIFLALLKNSYLAVLLLLPPAYFWTSVRDRRRVHGRILNFILLGGGAITLVTAVAVLTTIFHVGVAYWWLFLSASYGLISAYAVVLFLMAVAILLRLFRSFVLCL